MLVLDVVWFFSLVRCVCRVLMCVFSVVILLVVGICRCLSMFCIWLLKVFFILF